MPRPWRRCISGLCCCAACKWPTAHSMSMYVQLYQYTAHGTGTATATRLGVRTAVREWLIRPSACDPVLAGTKTAVCGLVARVALKSYAARLTAVVASEGNRRSAHSVAFALTIDMPLAMC